MMASKAFIAPSAESATMTSRSQECSKFKWDIYYSSQGRIVVNDDAAIWSIKYAATYSASYLITYSTTTSW